MNADRVKKKKKSNPFGPLWWLIAFRWVKILNLTGRVRNAFPTRSFQCCSSAINLSSSAVNPQLIITVLLRSITLPSSYLYSNPSIQPRQGGCLIVTRLGMSYSIKLLSPPHPPTPKCSFSQHAADSHCHLLRLSSIFLAACNEYISPDLIHVLPWCMGPCTLPSPWLLWKRMTSAGRWWTDRKGISISRAAQGCS